MEVQPSEFGQPVKGSHSDVLERIVAEVYRHRIAKVLKSIVIETSERVPLEVELERADP